MWFVRVLPELFEDVANLLLAQLLSDLRPSLLSAKRTLGVPHFLRPAVSPFDGIVPRLGSNPPLALQGLGGGCVQFVFFQGRLSSRGHEVFDDLLLFYKAFAEGVVLAFELHQLLVSHISAPSNLDGAGSV
jgi:hypothetical protein